jgi:hypothetical protein
MSYTNLHARLEGARDSIWAELQAADDELEVAAIDTEAAKELHPLEVKRLFAGCGLRAAAEAIHKIDRSLKRDKWMIGSDAEAAIAYERIVSFAEGVAEKEIKAFREADRDYSEALKLLENSSKEKCDDLPIQ